MANEIFIATDVVPTTETKITIAGVLKVPPIAIGAWAWGDTRVWYVNSFFFFFGGGVAYEC